MHRSIAHVRVRPLASPGRRLHVRRGASRAVGLLIGLLTAFLGLVLGASPAAAATYPTPVPDFAHPSTPHDPLYSPVGGTRDRPMLVVYLRFSDITAPTGVNAAWTATRFFGPFPSVAGYFRDDSWGNLVLTRANESDATDGGAANDGVVTVDAGTWSAFAALSEGDQDKRVLELADPSVNYASFDTDGNGALTDDEIVVHALFEEAATSGGCGGTRGVSPVSLDGKALGRLSVARDGTSTNLITIIHETGHVAFHMGDFYGFGVGSFDIAGPTCGAADTTLFRTSSWQKMHLGWIRPTVVTRDGYYTVDRADRAPTGFILYDPDAGTDSYLMVENRGRVPSSYDQAASDTGLVIWKIIESNYNSGDEAVRPIDLQRPDGTRTPGCSGSCYGGSDRDAWDPADTATPQRTHTGTGTLSRLAVRAVPAAGERPRVFFDVRGPGVLVDPLTAQGQTRQATVTPTEERVITFPVMNTGEATDTFDFTITGLPAGWTASTDTRTLGDHEGAVASVRLVPAADAPTGVTALRVRGTSRSDGAVTSDAPILVNVVLDRTRLEYAGAASAPTGEPAGFAVRATNLDDPGEPPIQGAPITFTLTGGGGTLTATATTDATGRAVANPVLSLPPGEYSLTTSMPRVGKHEPASVRSTYTVERRPTVLVYGGDLTGDYSDPAAMRAVLTDAISGAALAAQQVVFELGTQTASATTDAYGVAATTIVVDQPSGTATLAARFPGDATYLPSTDSDTFDITKETLAFAYTGDLVVSAPGVPTLAARATEEGDGSAGDLSRASALFSLAPTLTSTPYEFGAPVSTTGDATVAATDLPVDLWSVTVAVPATNSYWEGSMPAAVELVRQDLLRNVEGEGRGTDTAGRSVRLNVADIRYRTDGWRNSTRFESPLGTFVGDSYAWLVAVGDTALFQVAGRWGPMDTPATLRVRMHDAGATSTRGDWFSGRLVESTTGATYDSGPVRVTAGNLQVR